MERYIRKDLQRDFPDDTACLDRRVSVSFPDGITCAKCQKVTKHYLVVKPAA